MTAQAAIRSPKGRFPLGNAREFNADTLGFMLDIRQYGDIARAWFGPFPLLIANHPDLFHQVLVTDADKYLKSRVTKRATYPVIGNGIFTSDGEFWKRQRKLVQPAFHIRRIGSYAQVMVDYAEAMIQCWESGEVYDIDREMTSLTMNVIAKTLFNADVSKESREIGEVIAISLAIVNKRLSTVIALPDWLPTAENRRLARTVRRLDETIQKFIDDRRASGEDTGDLLSMLLIAQDDDGGQMTDKQVRDEAMTLFGAGHETTAVTLMWTWYLLSQHPEVEAKLMRELNTVLGGRPPQLDDLPRLPYTEMLVKETLRLYPPAFGTTREAIADTEIGGTTLKKGNPIYLNIYGVHRDARFFPEPDRFDPERFSPANEKQIAKYAYLPFGGGPRVCIGNAFAMMEARLILATVAQQYRLSVAPGHQVVPDRMFTLRPKYGLKMVATKREPALEPA